MGVSSCEIQQRHKDRGAADEQCLNEETALVSMISQLNTEPCKKISECLDMQG